MAFLFPIHCRTNEQKTNKKRTKKRTKKGEKKEERHNYDT